MVLDLASAYKQFAFHPSCRKYSAVAPKRPGTNAVQMFRGTGVAIRVNCERGALQRSKLLHCIGKINREFL